MKTVTKKNKSKSKGKKTPINVEIKGNQPIRCIPTVDRWVDLDMVTKKELEKADCTILSMRIRAKTKNYHDEISFDIPPSITGGSKKVYKRKEKTGGIGAISIEFSIDFANNDALERFKKLLKKQQPDAEFRTQWIIVETKNEDIIKFKRDTKTTITLLIEILNGKNQERYNEPDLFEACLGISDNKCLLSYTEPGRVCI